MTLLIVTGGYYTAKTTHGIRIVAFNTNLYYTSNKQVVNESDPADQFQWLNMTLSGAERNQEKVIKIIPEVIKPISSSTKLSMKF